jgi:TRAP-type C4-dicarboxylate transport system permease small subunit
MTPHDVPDAARIPGSRAFRGLNAAVNRVSLAMSLLAGLGIILIMVGSVADVTRRAVTGHSIPGINEAAEVALVIVVFVGLIGAQTSGSQIATPVVTNRLPARAGHAVRALALWFAAVVVLWMTAETAVAGYESWQAKEFRFGLAAVPIWPAKLVIPVGLACLVLALIVQGLDHAGRFRRNDPKQTTQYQEL